MKKLKLIITSLIAAALLGVPILAPAMVSAQTIGGIGESLANNPDSSLKEGLCQGANLQVGSTCQSVDAASANKKVNDTITWAINIFSVVVGIAAVIMIIVGGLRYIISGGDSGNVQSAKNTILYAIIGLVVVALAQFVVRFVLTRINAS